MKRAQVFCLAVFAALAASTAACGSKTVESAAGEVALPDSATVLVVDNQGLLDMNIFLLEGGAVRRRLGTATGLTKTRLTIPNTVVGNGRDLQFVADPIASRGNSVSRRIFVRRGDEVVLTILR
jgi:predicted small secreted protein